MKKQLAHSLRRLGFAAALAFLGTLVGASGCSSECESSKCATGNACIDDGSGSGETCHKTCTSQVECPFGWYCNDGQLTSQHKNWCVKNTNFPPEGPMQWGTMCSPAGGEGANKDCDWNDYFACYGTNPTDAMAFCTEYGCTEDSDCKGGWWCSTQNVGPNVVSADATFGKTRKLCLPRRYCAPCETDHDCAQDLTPQHCAPDTQGKGYCAPQCSGDAACAPDAACVVPWNVCAPASGPNCKSDDDCPSAAGTFQHCDSGKCTLECAGAKDCSGAGQSCLPSSVKVCKPRAGVCVGDGAFCSPCRSDVDCTDGFCVSGAPFSTERFCTAQSNVAMCDSTVMNPPGCPAPTANAKAVQCTTAPVDQCIALVTLGAKTGQGQFVPGCWTPNR